MDIKMTNSQGKMFQIKNGPSKDRIIDAFKYAHDNTVKVPVTFVIALRDEGATFTQMHIDGIKINSAEYEDGSGHKFNLRGYCYASFEETIAGRKPILYCCNYVAYYNSATRTGHIKLTRQY